MLVEFAYPYTVDGISYKADESASLEAGIAASLLNSGIVRKAPSVTPEVQTSPVETTEVEAVTIPEAPKSQIRSSKKES